MSVIRNGRAATKTITFAMVHFVVAFSVAYLLTGSIGISGLLALLEPMANTAAFYLHERVWERMRGCGTVTLAPQQAG